MTTVVNDATTMGAIMVDIMVLLDHSASTTRFQGLNAFYNPAIIDWSNTFVDNLPLARCPVGFTVFENNVQTLQTITSDNAVLNGVINALATDNTIPFASSAVDLGITEATNQLINNGNAGANKVLVVLLDGSSNNDAATEAAAVAAENVGVETWVVTFPTLMGVAITQTQLLAISRNPSRIISVNNDQELPPVAANLVLSVCP
ncbi:uncharacterized protein LOC124270585 [Haliotis rubra]|uniref:uncharacterized protein LOC124270585 n=1 Tax=Haliotis rubra TaxID=36100 RepID=UPI001EE61B7A|nr:uncharacterized protein LOC124270585 [Haliotis rubra]